MSLDVWLMIAEEEVFSGNITHNLSGMAKEAGIYDALWRPDEAGYEVASDLIEPLRNGIRKMKERPEYFENFNSPNGWGLYKNFVPFCDEYLFACEKYPNATISVWR